MSIVSIRVCLTDSCVQGGAAMHADSRDAVAAAFPTLGSPCMWVEHANQAFIRDVCIAGARRVAANMASMVSGGCSDGESHARARRTGV